MFSPILNAQEKANEYEIHRVAFELSVLPDGLEAIDKSTAKTRSVNQSDAKCGALAAQSGPNDPDLTMVVSAWPRLPSALKVGIVAMIRTSVRDDE